MNFKLLTYVSLACSVAGILLLFVLSQSLELESTSIDQISWADLGKNMKVCGKIVSKFVSKNGHVFLRLGDETGVIKVVVFENLASKLHAYELRKGDEVCVSGRVDQYKNQLEIIPLKLEKI